MPEAKYPPYKKFSPFFVRSEVNPTNDNVWNRDRAGSCLEDVLYEFPREVGNKKTQPISWVLGTCYNDGNRVVNINILNGMHHHETHKKIDVSIPTQFINDKGFYRTALIGNTVGHYLPEKKAVFCMGEVKEIDYKKPNYKDNKNHIIIMRDTQFLPKELIIEQGDIVTWINHEDTTSHTVFSGSFNDVENLGVKSKSPIIKARNGEYGMQFGDVGEFWFSSVTYEPMSCKIKVIPKDLSNKIEETNNKDLKYYIKIFKRLGWSNNRIISWMKSRKR